MSRRVSGSNGGGRTGQRQNAAPQPRGKKAAAGRKKPVKQPLKMPTSKQMQTVSCPACNASVGEPCTLRGGHQARVAAFRLRATNGLPAAPKNQRKPQKVRSQGEKPEQLKISRSDSPPSPAKRSKGIVSPFRQLSPSPPPACPLCEKPIGARDAMDRTSDGELAHARCVTGTNPVKAPRDGFAANKARVEAGVTFRGRKPSGWRLGSSPSNAGEISR